MPVTNSRTILEDRLVLGRGGHNTLPWVQMKKGDSRATEENPLLTDPRLEQEKSPFRRFRHLS